MIARIQIVLAAVFVAVAAAAPAALAEDYVAMGDSYSSGTGTGTYYDTSCMRSNLAYPGLIRSSFGATYRMVACSGAVINDVTTNSQNGNPPQVNLLDAGTDFVTISIGGNDAGFSKVLTSCANPVAGSCNGDIDAAQAYIQNTLPGRLDTVYSLIRQRAPNAKVAVVGYPRIFKPGSDDCNPFTSINAQEATRLNETADLLSTVVSARARAHQFAYANAIPAFVGHAICDSDPWINNFNVSSTGEAYHPNISGHSLGYAPVVRAALLSDIDAPQTTITSGPRPIDNDPTPTNDSTPTFTFTSSETGSSFECRVDTAAFTACASPYTTTTLADGPHVFAVRATDAASNTDETPAQFSFIVDTSAPQTTITSGPSEGELIGTATPTFGLASETGATFACSVDGGAFSGCSSPYTTPSLSDGAHTVAIRATDAAGNTDTTPATRSFTVDTDPPETSITSGPGDGSLITDATPSFEFSASEPSATLQCSVDAAPFASCASPFTTDPLADGVHTFSVRAVDAAGNSDPSPASTAFTLDTTTPQTTIDSGPGQGSATNNPAPTFSFSASEVASFECKVDGAVFSTCASPMTAGPLADGLHSFSVRASDAAGHVDQTPATVTFTIDTLPPDTTISGGPAEGSTTASRASTFSLASSQPGSSFRCRLDSAAEAAFAPCGSSFVTPSLSDGPHTFDVRAVDPAGNVDASPASRTFTVDATPPETTIDPGTGPAPGSTTQNQTPAFAFSSSEAGTFECRVDSAQFAPCSSPFTTAALSDGRHSFDVRATDAAVNTDQTPASRSFTIDTTAPETTIGSGPPQGSTISNRTPAFTFSSEFGATYECRVDTAAFTACASPYTTTTLADGPHVFAVRAIDGAANIDATPATRSFAVETVPPETAIDSGPAAGAATSDSTPAFAFSSTEAGSRFECRVDGDAYAPCASPVSLGPLTDGAHTFDVRAIDPAGNTDLTAASRSFSVDATPPETTIDSGPTRTTTSHTPIFGFSSEPGSSFECRVDSAPFASCASPFATPVLADGPHNFAVRALDAVSNADPTPATRSFTVGPLASPPAQPHQVAILSRSATLSRNGVALIRLRCPPTSGRACAGKLALTSAAKVKVGRRRVKLALGAASFQVQIGRTSTVRVRLSRRARTAVTRAKRLRATVRVRAPGLRDAVRTVVLRSARR